MKRCMHKTIHCRNVCHRKRQETTKMSSVGSWLTKQCKIHIMEYNTDFFKRNMKYLYIRLQSDLQDIVKITARWRKHVLNTVIHLR